MAKIETTVPFLPTVLEWNKNQVTPYKLKETENGVDITHIILRGIWQFLAKRHYKLTDSILYSFYEYIKDFDKKSIVEIYIESYKKVEMINENKCIPDYNDKINISNDVYEMLRKVSGVFTKKTGIDFTVLDICKIILTSEL